MPKSAFAEYMAKISADMQRICTKPTNIQLQNSQ